MSSVQNKTLGEVINSSCISDEMNQCNGEVLLHKLLGHKFPALDPCIDNRGVCHKESPFLDLRRGGRQVVSDFGERKLIIDCWLFMFAEVGMALLGLAVWRKSDFRSEGKQVLSTTHKEAWKIR